MHRERATVLATLWTDSIKGSWNRLCANLAKAGFREALIDAVAVMTEKVKVL